MLPEGPCGSSKRHFLGRLIRIRILREMLVDDLIPLGKSVSVETTPPECEQIPILDVAVRFASGLPELSRCLGDNELWSIRPVIWSDGALDNFVERSVRVCVAHDMRFGQLQLLPRVEPFTEGILAEVRHDPQSERHRRVASTV